jgi:hypothetical protein
LKCLALRYPDGNANNIGVLVEAACSSPVLEELELCGCALSSVTIEQFGQARLKSITIEDPDESMDEAERKLMATTLPKNKYLESLRLGRCGIGDMGVKELVEALPQDTNLRTLALPANSVGDAGAKALGEALPKIKTLKSLNVDHNHRISEDGSSHLLAGLEKNTSIEEFSGIPYDVEQTKAEYLIALNKAGYKTYKETENMHDNDWVEALDRFESAGGLSTRYDALRSKPHFVFVRPESEIPAAENIGFGKRKRDEDYA